MMKHDAEALMLLENRRRLPSLFLPDYYVQHA